LGCHENDFVFKNKYLNSLVLQIYTGEVVISRAFFFSHVITSSLYKKNLFPAK